MHFPKALHVMESTLLLKYCQRNASSNVSSVNRWLYLEINKLRYVMVYTTVRTSVNRWFTEVLIFHSIYELRTWETEATKTVIRGRSYKDDPRWLIHASLRARLTPHFNIQNVVQCLGTSFLKMKFTPRICSPKIVLRLGCVTQSILQKSDMSPMASGYESLVRLRLRIRKTKSID